MKITSKKLFQAAALLFCLASPLTGFGAIAHVTVNNTPTGFVPAVTNISTGDTVIWTWPSGSNVHNVTSTSTPQKWTASGTLSGPANFTNVFSASGTYPYKCSVHNFTGQVIVAAAASLPPTVAINSPVAGTLFVAPASVTIQATASDPNAGGSITNVQFLVGASSILNQTIAPFAATTNGLLSGTYTLSAIATANSGLKATNSVNIVVDAPPTITITNPTAGTVLAEPANVTVKASAADSDGTVTNVQFLLGSAVIGNSTAAPFTVTTDNVTAGTYTLTAIASDNSGITATNSISLSVVTPLPVTLSATPHFVSGNFQFAYAANPGLTYIIQESQNLQSSNWVSLVTNLAASNPATFVDSNTAFGPAFYRVIRQANP